MPSDCSETDLDPSALESMRRMAYDRSKWLQTCTYDITKYEYNKEELNQFYDELQDVIVRVRGRIVCSSCNVQPKKSVVLPCGHLFCQRCSARLLNKKQTDCPTCKEDTAEGKVFPFYAMDSLVRDMALFLKEAKFFQDPDAKVLKEPKDVAKRLKSMNFVLLQRLKNIESQLMCDFCFSRIKKTFLVNCASDAFTRRPFCQGCDAKYIKFYEKEQGRTLMQPIRFALFDEIVDEFYEFFTKVVDYSKSCKEPTRFLSSTPRISLTPIYKLLAGTILIGIALMYYSS